MFQYIISKIKNISFKEESLSSAAVIVSSLYLVSAVFGLIKSRLLTTYYGDSIELGVFYLADRLHTFLFSLLVTTVISSAFIPVLSQNKKKNSESAYEFTNNILNLTLIIYIVLSVIVFLFSDFFSYLLSWGSLTAGSQELTSLLIRYIFVAQVFLIVSTYFSSFLHSYKSFLIPALIPIFYNISIILGIFLFFDYLQVKILAPVYGMIIGGIVGVLIQFPFLYIRGFRYKMSINLFSKNVKDTLLITFPRVVSISAHQLYVLVINGLITFIYTSPSFIVIYSLANQLQTMPVNAFGTSLSQAMLPTLSEYALDNNRRKISSILQKYIVRIAYIILPISMLFFVLKIPIVRLLFGGDKFSWLGTNLTAYTLAFFSISIFFQTISIIFSKVFYSFHNSKIPTYSSLIGLVISFMLSYVFSSFMGFGVWSFALAFSFGSFITTVILYYYLSKEVGNFIKDIIKEIVIISYSTLFSGTVIYFLMKFLEDVLFDTTRTVPLFILTTTIILIGMGLYLVSTSLMNIKYYQNFRQLLLKK